MKNWQKLLLRLFISIGVIAFLLTQVVDVTAIGDAMINADLSFLIFTFILMALGIIIHSYKWYILLEAFDLRIPFRQAVFMFWGSMFFNLFLPSTIGGDVIRGYQLSKYSHRVVSSATSVIVDRLTGLISLLLIALVAWLIGYREIDIPYIGWIIVAGFALLILFTFLMINKSFAVQLQSLVSKIGLSSLANAIREFNLNASNCWNHKLILIRVLFIGIVFQLVAILCGYLISEAISIELPVQYFFIFVPVATVVSLLPISINGIGIQDSVYVLLFSQVGVPASAALSFSFLWHIIRILVSTPGIAAYLMVKKPHERAVNKLPPDEYRSSSDYEEMSK